MPDVMGRNTDEGVAINGISTERRRKTNTEQ